MGSFSREYFELLDTVHDGIAGVSAEIVDHDAFPRVVPEWMLMLHQIIRGSTPMLAFARDQLDRYDPADPFIGTLRAFYETKIIEEDGHDTMLLKDLELIGTPREHVEQQLPPASISAMVGSQYYLTAFYHPAALLGYLGLLEGYPAPPEHVDELIRRSGVPAEAWSTYRMHAEVDPWHRQELEEILDQVPERETAIRQAIIANGVRTGEFYCQALEALLGRMRTS